MEITVQVLALLEIQGIKSIQYYINATFPLQNFHRWYIQRAGLAVLIHDCKKDAILIMHFLCLHPKIKLTLQLRTLSKCMLCLFTTVKICDIYNALFMSTSNNKLVNFAAKNLKLQNRCYMFLLLTYDYNDSQKFLPCVEHHLP